MTALRENTDKSFTKLQNKSVKSWSGETFLSPGIVDPYYSSLEYLNPELDKFLRQQCGLRAAPAQTPVSLLRGLIESVHNVNFVQSIEVVKGKLVFKNEDMVSADTLRGIKAMERTINEYDSLNGTTALTLIADQCDRLFIDPVIQSWIPQKSQIEAIRADIISRGVVNPIRYWVNDGKKIIIDGCVRYSICLELGIKYPVREEFYPTVEAAIDARIDAHLTERNLSPNAINYLIGARYVRKVEANNKKVKNVATEFAKLYGKTDTTIRNHGNFYRAVKFICSNLKAPIDKEFENKLFQNEIKFTLSNIKLYHKLDPLSIENAVGSSFSTGVLPELPTLEIGSSVKIAPSKGNRSLDEYVDKVGKYIGISASGRPMVEVEGNTVVTSVLEMHDDANWVKKVEKNSRRMLVAPINQDLSSIKKKEQRACTHVGRGKREVLKDTATHKGRSWDGDLNPNPSTQRIDDGDLNPFLRPTCGEQKRLCSSDLDAIANPLGLPSSFVEAQGGDARLMLDEVESLVNIVDDLLDKIEYLVSRDELTQTQIKRLEDLAHRHILLPLNVTSQR